MVSRGRGSNRILLGWVVLYDGELTGRGSTCRVQGPLALPESLLGGARKEEPGVVTQSHLQELCHPGPLRGLLASLSLYDLTC